MKKLYFFLLTLSTGIVASAANYFVPGTVWEYNIFNGVFFEDQTVRLEPSDETEADGVYRTVIHSVFTDCDGNTMPGEERTSEGNPIKVDGEKVYELVKSAGEAEWQLVYDFSLKLGEGCLIKENEHYWQGYESEPQEECYFKYVEDTYLEKYDASAMVLKVFRSSEDSEDETKAIRTYYWIPGVGSTDYFDGAYFFPLKEVDGAIAYPSLTRVTDADGNVIVEYRGHVEIDTVEATDAESPAQYFDLQGRRVANPAHGLYILRQGAKAAKILL